jgi:hypothetical protein
MMMDYFVKINSKLPLLIISQFVFKVSQGPLTNSKNAINTSKTLLSPDSNSIGNFYIYHLYHHNIIYYIDRHDLVV